MVDTGTQSPIFAVMRRGGVSLLAAVVGVAVLVGSARAEIYVYRDQHGSLHFTNAPVRPGYRHLLSGLGTGKMQPLTRLDRRRIRAFDPIIADAARRHDVDAALVKAVIYVESRFSPYARSAKGAQGLMQLMPATARMHGVGHVFDPRENIEGGVKHLRYLLDRYHGNVRLALAAYNAGSDAVRRYGGVPPYRETRQYLNKVLWYRQQYLRRP